METKLRSRLVIYRNEINTIKGCIFSSKGLSVGPVQWETRNVRRRPEKCLETGWSHGHQTPWVPASEYSHHLKIVQILMKLTRIDVNLKYETYCNAISDGGETEWDFGWQRYENSQE